MASTGPGDATGDVQVSFTRHAMHRLRERFGVALDELRKLIHNIFSFESYSVSGITNWRMVVPMRYYFIGTFEGDCFIVKTVFFNLSQNTKKLLKQVRRLRIMDISYPPAAEPSCSTGLSDCGDEDSCSTT